MKYILIVFLLFIFSSCSSVTPNLKEVRNTLVTSSLFKENLRSGYIDLADEQWKKGDKKNARIYADKAINLVKSKSYTPSIDPLVGRRLPIQTLDELSTERSFLANMLANGLPEDKPLLAASAQLSFDCWVEHAEEFKGKNKYSKCRHKYFTLKDEMLDIIENKEAIAAQEDLQKKQLAFQQQRQTEQQYQLALANAQKQNQQLQESLKNKPPENNFWSNTNGAKAGSYIVFFDLNSDKLNDSAKQIIQKIIDHTYSAKPAKVVITGHADLSGSVEYNMKLSLRRAESIARELRKNGISDNLLDVRSYGENSPNIFTKDEVKEAKNRFAKVYFLRYDKTYY